MTTSGTVGQTSIEVATIIDHAFRRAGLSPAMQTSDNIAAAKNNLYFYLSALSNDGVNLWTIEKEVLGLNVARANYPMGVGTVDIKNILRRTVTLPSDGTAYSSAGGSADYAFDQDLSTACTQTSADGYISYTFGSATTISNVGFMPRGDQTYTLAWEYSSDNITWYDLLTLDQEDYTDQDWYYWDIDRPVSALAYRVRETGGGTLDMREVVFAVVTLEIPVARMNFDQYSNLTNKTFGSDNPLQYWYNRKYENPEILIWPVPDNPFYQLVVWKTRQIQDVGELTNTLELPQRWVDSSITELAVRMLLELPNVDSSRYDILKKEAAAATFRAQQEERDNSPITIAPNIGCYTR